MASPICYGSKDIVRIRIAQLTSTGAPATGAGAGYVSDAVVSVERTPRVEAGEEVVVKNGGGTICQQFQDPDLTKGQDLVVKICTQDLKLIAMMTDGEAFSDGTGTMGYKERLVADGQADPVSFEWWSIAWDGSSQASISGSGLYWQRVVPFVTFVRAGDTYEKGLTVFTLNGKGSENPNITKNGPFDDWPSQIPNDGPTSGFAEWRTTTVPTAACAAITVSSTAS